MQGWHEREKKISHRLRNERSKLRVDINDANLSLAQTNEAVTKLDEDIMQQYNQFMAAMDGENDEIEETRLYRNQIADRNVQVNELDGQLKGASVALERERKESIRAMEEIARQKDTAAGLMRRIDALEGERDRLRNSIEEHDKAVLDYDEGLDQLKVTIRGLQQKNVELIATISRYESQAEDARSSIRALQQELEEANETILKERGNTTAVHPLPHIGATISKQEDGKSADEKPSKSGRLTVIDLIDDDDSKPVAQRIPFDYSQSRYI
ncbi:hypothetical protein VF21_07748 [Pseudogymnoascus sp. 05NY08]|nr:hypothetical protein VF21_07748 [Pseudogymnoascus sp. 05NY08]